MRFLRSILRRILSVYQGLMESSRKRSLLYKLWIVIKNWCGERLTVRGKVVMLASSATCLAGAFPEHTNGSFAFSLFVALILLSLATSVLRVPRVKIQRFLTERCIAGAAIPLKITVTNETSKGVADLGAYEFRLPPGLSLIDPPQYSAMLPPGKSETFTYQLATTKRGAYHLKGPTALSPFPYGLTQSTRFSSQPQRLIVYPSFKPLQTLNVPLGARHQPGGIALLSHVGESMEFVGTREYRAGDRIRDIHPRTWARVGFPVVKQYQEEMLTRVAIVLDTFIPIDSTPRALEAALSMTAAVTEHLASKDYVVDFFAAGPELFDLQAGRSLGYLDNILDILACVEPSAKDPLAQIAPKLGDQIAQTSTVIAVLLGWDRERQHFVANLESHGLRVKPIVISDVLRTSDLVGGGPYAVVVTPQEVESGIPSV